MTNPTTRHISRLAWRIMSDNNISDESYRHAEEIYKLTADPVVVGERPLKIKVTYVDMIGDAQIPRTN